MNNIYMRQDYEIQDKYRVMTYAECRGYWSTSELMNKEEAQERVDLYTESET